MFRNRWLPAILAATTLAAGCAGGPSSTALPTSQQVVPDSTLVSQNLKTTAAPAAALKKMVDGFGNSPQPTWQYVEPLEISNSGTFAVPPGVSTCSPMNPLFGLWYIALGSFTLPMNSVSLPTCTIASSQAWAKKRSNFGPPAAPAINNLYIVELNIGFFSSSVTPIAGPGLNGGSTTTFQPMVNNLSFNRGNFYAFFVASYTGPTLAQPPVPCGIGATTCSLGANPTPGNKVAVVVSDGSGALPNLVVKDSAGNTLTQETISPNCGHCVGVYDETVPAGGIGNTVTYVNGVSPFYPYVTAIYELANVTAGRFASANTGGIQSSLATTIPGVTNYDIQLCAYMQTGLSPSNVTLAFSNGSAETYDAQATNVVFGHETATATASSTCTANNVNTDYQAGMAYADYP